ncbi:Methionine aminopeptidase [Candidatus Fokinia solitaria]|uniref:Methionine aminopeptidase n=1 Tax=Candidatus Fokinia solitaria TaxID=1802984 RepID=A0A2U8BSP5_9RICK|nr:type I methionyl aminopeptidase [Candidatus Fokinia solitaria]AWD33343.1 Methionine aminopeptidase [Candidatus Fokinia solitaria]
MNKYSLVDFEYMEKAGKLVASILDELSDFIKSGISTADIDDFCVERIAAAGAKSASLGYNGFPKSVCTSVNHVVCHGIPSRDKRLQATDILNVDITIILDGWYADASRTYFVSDAVPVIAKRLTQVTYNAMMKGISVVRSGIKLSDIGTVIQEEAKKYGYSVVHEYCGHGIGRVFHDAPIVPHYYCEDAAQVILEEGMCITIEPMLNVGKAETALMKDGWTVITKDRTLSAQFEHTIGVTKNGCKIFTRSDNEKSNFFNL